MAQHWKRSGLLARWLTFVCMGFVSACNFSSAREDRNQPFNRWYGYGVGDKLDPGDTKPIDLHGFEKGYVYAGGPGLKVVALKPNGDWPWDEATATITPSNIVTGLHFSITACDMPPIVEPNSFTGKMPEVPPQKCWRSAQEMERIGKAVQRYVHGRIVIQPKNEANLPDPNTEPYRSENAWNFNEVWKGCNEDTPLFLPEFKDPTGKVGDIEYFISRGMIWMNVNVRQNVIYIDGERVDPDTARKLAGERCRRDHPQYATFENISFNYSNSPQYTYEGSRIERSDYHNYLAFKGQQKFLRVKINVNAIGVATHCVITKSSGSSDLDIESCKLIIKKFRFHPSNDSAGHPTDGSGDYALWWDF